MICLASRGTRAHDLPSLPKSTPLGMFTGVRSLSVDAGDLGVSYSGGSLLF